MSSSKQPSTCIFTHSVGASIAGHALSDKIRAISQAGIKGIELFQGDLDAFVKSEEVLGAYNAVQASQTPPKEDNYDDEKPSDRLYWNAHGPCSLEDVKKELFCAEYVARLCASLDVQIVSLQPIRDVEGWVDHTKQEEAMQRVRSRFPILRALGTDLLLCCSSCQPASEAHNDEQRIVQEFQQLADEAACFDGDGDIRSRHPIRIAFEALSWGTHIDTWAGAYAIVQRVNRPNFGLCLDSFNTVSREFADPCERSGVQEPKETTSLLFDASLRALRFAVKESKIFIVQLGDASKPAHGPLSHSPNEQEERPARMIWSRGSRLFPGEVERGAYLPIVPFLQSVKAIGYGGPWSVEVFNDSLNEQGDQVQREHASRAKKSFDWLSERLQER